MRVMLTKDNCPFCQEALRAVNIFNAEYPIDMIQVVDTKMPSYRKYKNFLVKFTGGAFNTPLVFIDGIVVRSSAGWHEMLAYLEKLHVIKEEGG